ncbi:MAG: ribosome maturation factor RimP [Thermodesulfobacteriota bacterium]
MSQLEKIIEEVRQLAEPMLRAQGFELVDVEYQRERQGWVLRIYIDRQGGVNIENCAEVNRELGTILDVHDIIPNPYTLEVSSPGLTRPLKKLDDFSRYQGRLIKVKTWQPIGKRGRIFKGRLMGIDGEKIIVKVDNEVIEIHFPSIAKANLEIDF